jgi:hypothetical protein
LILKLFTPLKELVKGGVFFCLLVKVNPKNIKNTKEKVAFTMHTAQIFAPYTNLRKLFLTIG